MDKPRNASDVEHEIAIRLWDGDDTVLGEILVQYAGPLGKSLGRKYPSLSSEDIEDIVCEAIKRLWIKRKGYYGPQRAIRALLYRIADNIAKDILKSGWQGLRQKMKQYTNFDIEKLATTCLNEDRVELLKAEDSALNTDLRAIVQSLPEIQQRIVWAFALSPDGEVNAAALGHELGYAASTIRVYLKRAKDQIRLQMEKRGHHLW